MPLDQKTGIVSADDTAYLLPAADPRPREPSAELRLPEVPAAGAAPAQDRVMRSDILRRAARILTIVGILTLLLYLLTRMWE